jgi:Domain of unknown function (DUF1854)
MTMLDPVNVSIEKSSGDALSVRLAAGRTYRDIAFVQLFPHSEPTRYISVRQKRDAGAAGAEYVEIGIIGSLSDLPESAQALVLEDISRRCFLPLITEIVSIKTKGGADTWMVETDKGKKTFAVRERSENVTTSDHGVVLITDVEKCRYKIADINALPFKSRSLLERVLL